MLHELVAEEDLQGLPSFVSDHLDEQSICSQVQMDPNFDLFPNNQSQNLFDLIANG